MENVFNSQQLSDYDEGLDQLSIDREENKQPEKQLWIIDGYKIWATSYEMAVRSAMMIERF